MAELNRRADGAVARQRQAVAQRRPPRRGPVHHQRKIGRPRGGEQRAGAGQVGGHRLLDHHGQPAAERAHAEIGGRAVVGKDHDGVEVAALEQGVEGVVRRHAAVEVAEPLPQARIGLGGRDEAAMLAGRQRREVAPHVIVAQPEDADAQPRHAGDIVAAVERLRIRSRDARATVRVTRPLYDPQP